MLGAKFLCLRQRCARQMPHGAARRRAQSVPRWPLCAPGRSRVCRVGRRPSPCVASLYVIPRKYPPLDQDKTGVAEGSTAELCALSSLLRATGPRVTKRRRTPRPPLHRHTVIHTVLLPHRTLRVACRSYTPLWGRSPVCEYMVPSRRCELSLSLSTPPRHHGILSPTGSLSHSGLRSAHAGLHTHTTHIRSRSRSRS